MTGAHAAIRGLRRAHGTFDPTEPRRLRRRSCGVCGVAGGLRSSILFLLQEEAVQTSAQLGGVVAPPMKGGDAAHAVWVVLLTLGAGGGAALSRLQRSKQACSSGRVASVASDALAPAASARGARWALGCRGAYPLSFA